MRRYVASIAAAHRAIGMEKTARSEPVRRALQRMHRRKGRRQEQAKGLTGALRERLLDAPGDGLIDARNRALLAVAYDTLLRRGELVALQVADIVEEMDGSATVLVRRSKADPEGRGATAYVARDSVALVREWLERSGVRHGRVFRSLARGVVGEGLDASQVPRIFKAMAERAGVPGEVVAGISGHSTGSGRRRTWSRAASEWRPSCTPGGGRRRRWSTATASASSRAEAARRSSPASSIASRGAVAYHGRTRRQCRRRVGAGQRSNRRIPQKSYRESNAPGRRPAGVGRRVAPTARAARPARPGREKPLLIQRLELCYGMAHSAFVVIGSGLAFTRRRRDLTN